MVAVIQNFLDPNKQTKMLTSDRVFVLEQIDDKAPLSSLGVIDKRLFTGENKLHCTRDEGSYNLWYFKYDSGVVPERLKGLRFTKFDQAKSHAEKYFSERNIRIKEVI